jgi:hypothetical protein
MALRPLSDERATDEIEKTQDAIRAAYGVTKGYPVHLPPSLRSGLSSHRFPSCLFEEIPEPLQVFFDSRLNSPDVSAVARSMKQRSFSTVGTPREDFLRRIELDAARNLQGTRSSRLGCGQCPARSPLGKRPRRAARSRVTQSRHKRPPFPIYASLAGSPPTSEVVRQVVEREELRFSRA